MFSPSVSVILSTYNQPQWLEKSLRGYAAQTLQDFEVVIADDGSDEKTRVCLAALQSQLPFRLKHVWHEDCGFRKCEILNKGIDASAADYLLFSDGDCVPRRDFIAAHLAHRAIGRFISGGYFKLPRSLSQAITPEDISAGRFADPKWLCENGLVKNNKLWKLMFHGWRAELLNRLTPTRASWNGHNASGWRADIERVNGFDERMQYGGEDRELGERMERIGIRGRQVRYSAIVLHLDHDRGYVKPEMLENNRRIRSDARRSRAIWTPYGLRKQPVP